jgi:predicted nuclease of predicted toxin-antitoxin system
MRILFDHGVPAPLRRALTAHTVSTAYEMGWAELDNGNLLKAAETNFDALVTADRNLRYQQNLGGRRLAIVVLPTNSWPKIQAHQLQIVAAVDALHPGDIVELDFS